MFTLQNLFYGLLVAALGILGLKFNYWLVNTTGPQEWIERYLGGGGTYTAYKLFSVLLVIAGLLWASGFGPGILETILSPLASLFQR